MKKIKSLTVLTILLVTFALLGTQAALASNRLVVYTPTAEELLQVLIPMFEEQTGIQVEIISAGTGELVKRVEVEQHNPYADVFMGSNPAVLNPISHLLDKYVSIHEDFIADGLKNIDGVYSHTGIDLHIILVNTELLDEMGIEVNGYADLLQPELKGKIAHGDATASSSAFLTIVNMLYAMGDRNDLFNEDAWDYIDQLLDNLDGKIASSSGVVHRSVAEGEYPVGLTWEIVALNWIVDGAPVKVIYPEEGVMAAGGVVAKIKGAKNSENAEKFIDFLLSQEAQEARAKVLNRPSRVGINLPEIMPGIDEMDYFMWDVEDVEAKKPAIIEKYIELLISK